MGLTSHSTGTKALDSGLVIQRQNAEDKVIALAGNPNVGKSTIFNSLTGMKQHTGNWPGKTVANAQGRYTCEGRTCILVDLPGTYSLMAHSAEEEIARNFLCFGKPDAIAVVCDASCLERNLNLVLQTMEISSRVVVCVNLTDEAEKKGIRIQTELLSQKLGVPVIPTVARNKKSLPALTHALCRMTQRTEPSVYHVRYPEPVEKALSILIPVLQEKTGGQPDSRWLALRLLDADDSLLGEMRHGLGDDFLEDKNMKDALKQASDLLLKSGIDTEAFRDLITASLVAEAEKLCQDVVLMERPVYQFRDWKLDHLLTSRLFGYPAMILLLAFLLWLTITGANYPSQALAALLFRFQDLKAGAVHGHGIWLQCRRRHRLPDHRFRQRTPPRHPDQQLCSLQRQISDPDCTDRDLFCRNVQKPLVLLPLRAAADPDDPSGNRHDTCRHLAALRHAA